MAMRILTTEEEFDAYAEWLSMQKDKNLWQSLERKQYLESLGKEVRIYVDGEDTIQSSALIAIDRSKRHISTWEISRGPLGKEREALLSHIIYEAQKDRALCVYLSPLKELALDEREMVPSTRFVHCSATRIIDLNASEETILKQMKQKGRYNIKVAKKNHIVIRASDDIQSFYALVSKTAHRDGFRALPKKKYERFLTDLPGSFLLLGFAGTKKEPICGLLGVLWGDTGIYYYGASSYDFRAKMAPYLLQWEAIRYCKKNGATQYDLLGIAPEGAPDNHPWRGITTFKEKFGGQIRTYPEEKMVLLRPLMYRLLQWKRKFLK